MDLWSNDPEKRLAAAKHQTLVKDWLCRLEAEAPVPMHPWPYGMPTSVNPFVLFLGISPGNAAPVGDPVHSECKPYSLPTAGIAHPCLYVKDTKKYWSRVRQLGTMIIKSHAPNLTDPEAHALIGQLNLSTSQAGDARDADFDHEYCKWVPKVIDLLQPKYLILLGLTSRLMGKDGKNLRLCEIDWRTPCKCFPFSYSTRKHQFRTWDRKGSRIVLWPQHPSKPPMTNEDWWQKSGEDFICQSKLVF